MKTFRLIRSSCGSASYNMAVDEKIFNQYLKDGIPVLRLYRWKSPSFTYGVTQAPESEIDFKQCLSSGIEVVKRITGGGILFHFDEITYSLVCSKQDIGEPQKVFVSYYKICSFLIHFYESLGLKACFALKTEDFKSRCRPHGFCSASYEKSDIIIKGRKIGGNAQRRNREVIFQHGSIPCSINWNFLRRYIKSLTEKISLYATTLSEELISVPDKNLLEQKLIDAFSDTFAVSFIEDKEMSYIAL